jgi:hypothetical protein
MAFVLADRVRETTTTTGTGTVTLLGAATGFQSFTAIGNGNNTYYTIAGQGTNEWEVGIGTYTSSGTTLSRDTVLSSSNSDALVNFSSGTKDVFVTQPAERTVYVGASNQTIYGANNAQGNMGLLVNADLISNNYTLPSGFNALSVGPISVASGVTVTVTSGQNWVTI